MEWMRTNNSTQQYWQDRPVLGTAFYSPEYFSPKVTPKGVPLEVMIQLANQIQAEPWFNMPHMADDNYITQFAQQVKANLSPNLSVYVEYSNEVWNTQFTQGTWIAKQAANQWLGADSTSQQRSKYGERTAEICDIWKQVFANQPTRVKCVMSGQMADTTVVKDALNCKLSAKQPCDQKHGIYAIAIAPYIGYYLGDPSAQYTVQNWTIAQLFQEIFSGGVLPKALNPPPGGALAQNKGWLNANASLAQQRNLKLVAYEGGQYLVGGSQAVQDKNVQLTNLFIAANRNTRMHDAYLKLLDDWKNTPGTETFINYSDVGAFSKSGSWGSLEDLSQTSSPKYGALIEFINSSSCWWNNCNITPSTPTVVVPSPQGDINTNTPTFTWPAIPGATIYKLWVNEYGFPNVPGKIDLNYTPAQANCASGGTCSVSPGVQFVAASAEWWTTAYFNNNTSQLSESRKFTVKSSTPTPKPVQLSPNGTISTTQPIYCWQPAPGATAYFIWVNQYGTQASDVVPGKIQITVSPSQANCSASECSFQPSTALVPGGAAWWVTAFSPTGGSTVSDGLYFQVQK